MEVVKHLKDYEKSTQDAIFKEFLDEHLGSLVCYEGVKNTDCLLEASKPIHDFAVYTNASPLEGARRLM